MGYANNSNYKNDVMIRKECHATRAVMRELRKTIEDSEILKEDDNHWPAPDRVGRQELEVVCGKEHISFTTSKIGSLSDVRHQRILKDCVSSITWCRTSSALYSASSASTFALSLSEQV